MRKNDVHFNHVESDASNRHFCAVFMPYGRRKFNEQSQTSLWRIEEILMGRKVSKLPLLCGIYGTHKHTDQSIQAAVNSC